MSLPAVPSDGSRPLVRGLAWAGAVSLALVLAVYAGAEAVVDRAFVEQRLSSGLSGRLPDPSVEVGAVRPLPHRLGLSVRDLRVEIGSPSTAEDGAGWSLLVPRLTVTGLWGSALVGGDDLRAERISITGATADLTRLPGASYPAGVANGIDLELREIRLTGGRRPDVASLLASLSRLDVPSYRARSADGHSLFLVRDFEADFRSGEAQLETMRLLITSAAVPPASGPEGAGTIEDTTEVAVTGLEGRGLAVVERDGARPHVRGRRVEIDSFRVTVVDGIVPDTSPDRGAPLTPVQRLRNFGAAAGRLDTLSFTRGRVRYTERRPGRLGTGTIVFDRIEGSVRPFPFGPARPSPDGPDGASSPVQLGVRGRVAGAAPLWLAITFPDRRRGLYFDAVGTVSALDLPNLNSIFRPTDGIEIEAGHLDSLRLRMRTNAATARGEVVPVYRGLGVSLVDPRGGGTGLDEHVRSFVLGLQLDSRNVPAEGDGFRTGSIEYRAAPGETFPAFFWNALLTGLRDAAGV